MGPRRFFLGGIQLGKDGAPDFYGWAEQWVYLFAGINSEQVTDHHLRKLPRGLQNYNLSGAFPAHNSGDHGMSVGGLQIMSF